MPVFSTREARTTGYISVRRRLVEETRTAAAKVPGALFLFYSFHVWKTYSEKVNNVTGTTSTCAIEERLTWAQVQREREIGELLFDCAPSSRKGRDAVR